MADSIDGFKPALPGPSPNIRETPAQQVRAGRSGFDGGSYFESSGRSVHPDHSLLHPPPTTGPKATAAEVLAQTLQALRPLMG